MEESSSTPRLQVPAPPLTVQTWENYLLPQTTIWKQSLWGLNGEKQIKCLPCAKSYKASTSSALWLLLTGLPHHTFQHPESPLAAWLTPTSFNTHNYISQQIGPQPVKPTTTDSLFHTPRPPSITLLSLNSSKARKTYVPALCLLFFSSAFRPQCRPGQGPWVFLLSLPRHSKTTALYKELTNKRYCIIFTLMLV